MYKAKFEVASTGELTDPRPGVLSLGIEFFLHLSFFFPFGLVGASASPLGGAPIGPPP